MAAVSSEIYPSRIWRLVVVACCILGAVALALAWTVERTREANNLVNHTQEVTRPKPVNAATC
jgi:anti-sigma-K factor RskA